MALNMRRSVYVKFKGIATAVAVLAIIAQPVYGFVAGQVASAAGNLAIVNTNAELVTAAADVTVTSISIKSSFNVTQKVVLSGRNVTVDGNGNKLTFVGDAAGWQGNYVLQAYKNIVEIKHLSITGGDAAVLANGATVKLSGTVNVSGNEFGGIEVSQGVGVTTPAVLNTSTATVVNTLEVVSKPTAWIANASVASATVNGSQFTQTTHIGLDQKQYYLHAVNAGIVAVNTNTGKTFSTIQSAVSDATTVDGHTIVVSPGAYSENVAVAKSLTIKGAQAGTDARTRAVGSESAVNGTFTVTAPNVTIDGFMFGSANAAVNFNAPGTKILNNIVTGSYAHGSFQTDHISTVANDVEISQNKFTGAGANIRFLGNKDDSKKASNVVVKDNTSDNAVSFLVINNTKNSTVTGNVVNAATGSAVAIQGGNDNLIIERNTIESSARTIYVTKEFIIGGVMYPKNSDIHVHFNNLLGGPSGATQVEGQTFKDNAQLPVDMTKNYWGSENGPYDNTADGISIPNVNPGQTDTNIGEITRNINYSSWLCQPFQDGLKIAVNGSCNEVPEVTLTTPVVNGLVSTNANGNRLNVTGTFMDDTAVNYLQLELVKDGNLVTVYTMHYSDAGLNSDGTFSVNIPVAENIPSGTYSLYYTGTDFTGGVTARMERTFVIDTVAPDAPTSLGWTTSTGVSIADNGTTAVYNGTASWQASTSGDTSQYIYKYWNDISTSQWKAGNKWEASPTSATSLGGVFNEGQGKHYFCVVAVDAAGNQSACSTPFGITYNTTVTPPTEPTDPEDEDTTQPGDNGSTNTGGNTPSPTNSSNSQSNQPSVSAPLALTNGFAFTNLGVATTPVANDDAAVLGTQTDDSDMSDTGVQGASVAKASTSAWNLMGLAWYWWILIAAIVAGFVWWMIAALRRRNQDA